MCKMRFVLSLVLVVGLIGCNTTPSPTATLPVETQTSTAQPIAPLVPTSTQTFAPPSPTPEPALRTNGPYFAYFRNVDEVYQLVMMDADGGGRKVIDLPKAVTDALAKTNYQLSARYLSPDGNWLAFYTGYAGTSYSAPTQTTYDLTLNVINMITGETQIVIPLLSKDYPNNFVEAVKKLNSPYITADDLQNAFLSGITWALSWSPDGKYLAFAGQMDGLSSDLYVYDMTTKKIQRLSSGDEELKWIDWSPDGKWILHGSLFAYGEGFQYSIYAAEITSPRILSLDSAFGFRWLNSHKFVEYENQNVFGNYNLRMVDLDTGVTTQVWDGSFHDFTVNPTSEWLLMYSDSSVMPPAEEKLNFAPGLQLINLKSLKVYQNPDPVSDIPDTFLRAEDGKIIALPEPAKANGEMIFASPDAKYWAVVVHQDMKIYAQDLSLVKEVSIPLDGAKLDDVQWSPDSSGLFLVCGANLYSMNVPDGNVNLVETNMIGYYGLTYKWINDQ